MQGEDGTKKGRRLVREKERKLITSVPRSSCYEMIRDGTFPKPVSISKQCRAWVESELFAWNEKRVAERDGKA